MAKAVRTESAELALCDVFVTCALDGECCPRPLAPCLEQVLTEKQKPGQGNSSGPIPGTVTAEPGSHSFLVISPPGSLQKRPSGSTKGTHSSSLHGSDSVFYLTARQPDTRHPLPDQLCCKCYLITALKTCPFTPSCHIA